MIRHGQTTTFQERLDITERAAAGQSDPEIATALGCEVGTVRKWRRPWSTTWAYWSQLSDGPPHHRAAQHASDGNARCHLADAPDASRVGADYPVGGTRG